MPPRPNLLAPAISENPHALYAELRRSPTLVQVDPGEMWAVTRYEDAVTVLKDPQRFSSREWTVRKTPEWMTPNPFDSPSLVTMDPPEHSKMRSVLGKAFGPSSIARLEGRIRAAAESIADEVVRVGEVDFVSGFALPLAATVICQLLGLDPALHVKFKRWTDDTILLITRQTPDQIPGIRASMDEMARYFLEVIEARRRQPGDDLVSELLRAEMDGRSLTQAEVLTFMRLLLLAGLDTSIHGVGNAMVVLSERPELLRTLRESPERMPDFVEEVLRYEPAAHATFRRATEEVELSGTRLPANSMLIVLIAAALRDERRFEDPDTFRLDRTNQGNLSFGHGGHFCLGAQLARMELRLGMEALVSRIRGVTRAPDPITWRFPINVRGPTALRVWLEKA